MKDLHVELKEAREKAGVSLEQIHEATRIRTDFLVRMEEGDFSIVPKPFLRAFLREYADCVGVTPDLVLQKFDGAIDSIFEPKPVEASAVKIHDSESPKTAAGQKQTKSQASHEKQATSAAKLKPEESKPEKTEPAPSPIRTASKDTSETPKPGLKPRQKETIPHDVRQLEVKPGEKKETAAEEKPVASEPEKQDVSTVKNESPSNQSTAVPPSHAAPMKEIHEETKPSDHTPEGESSAPDISDEPLPIVDRDRVHLPEGAESKRHSSSPDTFNETTSKGKQSVRPASAMSNPYAPIFTATLIAAMALSVIGYIAGFFM